MGGRHHWNKEIIVQFYATVFFGYALNERGESERAMYWMTEGEQKQITFSSFLAMFRLPNDASLRKLHDTGIVSTDEMRFMYPRSQRHLAGKTAPLYTFYSILNRLFRKTLTPRDGNPSNITAFQRNLMVAMRPGEPPFDVGDFIW